MDIQVHWLGKIGFSTRDSLVCWPERLPLKPSIAIPQFPWILEDRSSSPTESATKLQNIIYFLLSDALCLWNKLFIYNSWCGRFQTKFLCILWQTNAKKESRGSPVSIGAKSIFNAVRLSSSSLQDHWLSRSREFEVRHFEPVKCLRFSKTRVILSDASQ